MSKKNEQQRYNELSNLIPNIITDFIDRGVTGIDVEQWDSKDTFVFNGTREGGSSFKCTVTIGKDLKYITKTRSGAAICNDIDELISYLLILSND